jgi:beta-glucanase (GH16 family)
VLTWSDEFEGPAGALVDATKWVHDVGGHGWGNNELQTYTDRGRNASLGGDGTLQIRAFAEDFTGPDGRRRSYTSARLKTLGRFDQAYGRFEARIRVPQGQGLWPAFWMMGADFDEVGWPRCGEIDVMENLGREPTMVHAAAHAPASPRGFRSAGGTYTLSQSTFPAGFHVFSVEWEPSRLRFYVDGNPYQTLTPADFTPDGVWVFDKPFFMLLNVAVGGDWPGPPDGTTVFPQQMSVDYVRVYRRAG